MAFSCNTTYMPLAFEVYQHQETALTDLLKDFGFGAPTGIGYLVEETGIVPDDAWLRRATGAAATPGFEQVQLAIGQGAFLGTPLQLANAYAAIGNGGTLWTPRILTSRHAARWDRGRGRSSRRVARRDRRRRGRPRLRDRYARRRSSTLPYGTGTAAFAGFGIPRRGQVRARPRPARPTRMPGSRPMRRPTIPTISVATILPNIPLGTGGSDAAPLVRRVMAAHFAN